MKRQDVLSEFNVDSHGLIRTLGKFQAEMLYVPHFWEALMDGCPDEDINGIAFFLVTDEDRQEFPELHDVYAIALEESDQEFVYSNTFASSEEYESALNEAQETCPADEA